MIGQTLLLLLLLVLSAFFSGSEIALFSLGEARVRMLREEGRRGARALERLKSNPERLLATILIGNNVVNIGAAALVTAIALEAYGTPGVAYATGLTTLVVLVFGEITPKGLATANADAIALLVAPPIHVLSRILFPVVAPLETLTRWFVRRSQREGRLTVTEGEIREMTAIGHREGAIDEHERRIIDRAFRLDETRAWDIMTPRVDIFGWSADRGLASITGELPTLRFSRIPVFRDSVDDIVGILYTRDVYHALVSGQRDVTLGELAREPFFVPGSIPLTRLLGDFQTRRIHMGVVIDEYGGTDGVVTLEDILEELVGEIVDETDLEHQPVVRLSRNELAVEGNADLREINHFFNTAFPLLEHRSLNGYLLDELGYVPRPGEEIERERVLIRITEASETQVLKAILVRHGRPEESDVTVDAVDHGDAGGGETSAEERAPREATGSE
ncbi:MAG: hemolysin family protein [Gemmatimonadota bacterium]